MKQAIWASLRQSQAKEIQELPGTITAYIPGLVCMVYPHVVEAPFTFGQICSRRPDRLDLFATGSCRATAPHAHADCKFAIYKFTGKCLGALNLPIISGMLWDILGHLEPTTPISSGLGRLFRRSFLKKIVKTSQISQLQPCIVANTELPYTSKNGKFWGSWMKTSNRRGTRKTL